MGDGCTGKRRYLSGSEARQARRKHLVKTGQRLRIYHCVTCGVWHLTSSALPRETHERWHAQGRTGCVEKAKELLLEAHMQADLKRMERLERLADSWTSLAGLLNMRETT